MSDKSSEFRTEKSSKEEVSAHLDEFRISRESHLDAVESIMAPRILLLPMDIQEEARKMADIVLKKEHFGNAEQREQMENILSRATKEGKLDNLLEELNLEINKKNPKLTLSWTLRDDRDSRNPLAAVERGQYVSVRLYNARAGQVEDKLSAFVKDTSGYVYFSPLSSMKQFDSAVKSNSR